MWGQYAHTSGPVDLLSIATPPQMPSATPLPTETRTRTVTAITIYVYNNTSSSLCSLWVSASEDPSWGADRISSSLPSGSSIAITLPHAGSYDVKAHAFCGEGYQEILLWGQALTQGATVNINYP